MSTEVSPHQQRQGRLRFIGCAAIVGSLLALLVILPVFGLYSTDTSVNGLALLLVVLNGILWFLPAYIGWKRNRFDPFQPLIYAGWYFALSMIIIKGTSLALDQYSWILELTPDRSYYLNLALSYTALGWLGMLVGYYLPTSARFARRIKLPKLVSEERYLRWPALFVALIMGLHLQRHLQCKKVLMARD